MHVLESELVIMNASYFKIDWSAFPVVSLEEHEAKEKQYWHDKTLHWHDKHHASTSKPSQ